MSKRVLYQKCIQMYRSGYGNNVWFVRPEEEILTKNISNISVQCSSKLYVFQIQVKPFTKRVHEVLY